MRYVISVEEGDIDPTCRMNARSCPLARAITRQIAPRVALVHTGTLPPLPEGVEEIDSVTQRPLIAVYQNIQLHGDRKLIPLPVDAWLKVERFDKTGEMEPFTFSVEIP